MNNRLLHMLPGYFSPEHRRDLHEVRVSGIEHDAYDEHELLVVTHQAWEQVRKRRVI